MKNLTNWIMAFIILSILTGHIFAETQDSSPSHKTGVIIAVTNPLNAKRQDELIIVPLRKLQGIDMAGFVVRSGDKILPAQIEDLDFDGKADAIAFLIDMGPKQELKVNIENASGQSPTFTRRAHAEISVLATLPEAKGPGIKVFDGRFISKKELVRNPENKSSAYRFEGPLIESDKVGYRLYWDKRGAIDVFGKTSDMSVGEYHRGTHHTMQPWGRDLLHNGPALGVGGLGIGSDIHRLSPSGAPYAKIIIGSNGPIRSSYRMIYKNIEYQGHEYDLTWDIAMSAGKRYLTHTVNVTKGGELSMLAALTNHLEEGDVTKKRSLNQSGQLDWVGTYGKQVFRDDNPELAKKSKEQMGLGLLWPHRQLQKFNTNDLEFEAAFEPIKQLEYYSLVAYNQEKVSPIESDAEFYAYMQNLSNCLANPVIVKIEKDKLLYSRELMFNHSLKFAGRQLSKAVESIQDSTKFPTVSTDEIWRTAGSSDWMSGFFPGLLWFMYEATGEESWKEKAQAWTTGVEKEQFNTGNHDVGFMMYCSYGAGLRLTGDESYKKVLLQTADSLSQRYNPTVGCTRSWGSNTDNRNFEVIIDNMMNLELLLWASKNGGKKDFYDIAVSHSLKNIENHMRPDGSTYHVVNYDPVTGAVIAKRNAQGYAMESCWSRGQAWGLYGFTMVYRETGDERFLQAARRIADYFINNLPADYVPYWDFGAQKIPDEKKDSSAAAVAASGLLELSTLVSDSKKKEYFGVAKKILQSLSSPSYLAEGTNSPAILLSGVGSRYDARVPANHSFIFGDYYFIEALLRYKSLIETGHIDH